MTEEKTIELIKAYFKTGYVPSRGDTPYSYYEGYYTNCFEHACLNLNPEQLKALELSRENIHIFAPNDIYKENFVERTAKQMELFGLKLELEPTNKIKLAKNQWRVGLYWGNVDSFHFALEEPNGTWSSKSTWNIEVEHFDTMPKQIKGKGAWLPYLLEHTCIITNPYAESE